MDDGDAIGKNGEDRGVSEGMRSDSVVLSLFQVEIYEIVRL